MRLLQINVTANWGSTGRIAEEIGRLAIANGWESWIAYGREKGTPHSQSNLIRIGYDFDMKLHGLQTRLFDNHGLSSKRATRRFIEQISGINPDIIHLHNIHGYYLNYRILFDFLKEWGGPVVWTLHDCWTFTGHCSHYTYAGCTKWQTHCHDCPQLSQYPASLFRDRSFRNYVDKKAAFSGLPNLTIVPVSLWLADQIGNSFLKSCPCQVIRNGIDLKVFKPNGEGSGTEGTKRVLGVASVWNERKGLAYFHELRKLLPNDYEITLVGLSPAQIKALPQGIEGVERTNSVDELARIYTRSDVFVNPTLEDTFPTTNLEALACGTPVVTFRTGGSPEAIDNNTGIIIERGDVEGLAKAVVQACKIPFNPEDCRARAEANFNKDEAFRKYLGLYDRIACKG